MFKNGLGLKHSESSLKQLTLTVHGVTESGGIIIRRIFASGRIGDLFSGGLIFIIIIFLLGWVGGLIIIGFLRYFFPRWKLGFPPDKLRLF